MASTLEALQANIEAAIAPGYRQRLLARGQSRGMIWRKGVLPENAPKFSPDLSDNLLSFGYSLLLHGLRFIDLDGERGIAGKAFEVAAESLEAVVARGISSPERDFHRLIAAASYHLGRFSARAYSLLHEGLAESNLSVVERALAKLMLRDLDGLATDVSAWFASGVGTDEAIIQFITLPDKQHDAGDGDEQREDQVLEAMTLALEGNFMAAMSQALLALERGEQALAQSALERFREGLEVAGQLNLVAQWWVHRLAIHLVAGLWSTSFHAVLPLIGPAGAEVNDWQTLRKLFIASLHRRRRAEIELWPSQLPAANRVLDFDANLVLSLPTSAGKTRIAELCILACLARRKRVVFVTPLRALSAQTEVGLRRTFSPLGKTVSSLYGSIGASGTDVDALRARDVVVATPEKLDFALRSDPDLLDDVGLVVLDEGHMIGLGEREVRYEAQIQRLLRRADAASRRIICLSAILPDGEQLDDFAAWLTGDKVDGLIKDSWRPTRLRFGEVDWKPQGQYAQLSITVGDETPFVPKFIVGKKPTKGKGTKVFPSDQTELCIATAWRLMDDGQTVLVFCPLRVSVIPFAKRIIEMHKRGHIDSVLEHPVTALSAALSVGAEWFGADHEILQCLRLGVAVHHGELPTPYRKEIERLLRDGTLRLTVSSPTLAQGLNLAATSLVFHGTTRDRKILDISEFRNVVGRAGRAYVDIEGLVLYPMFDDHLKRRAAWRSLIDSDKGREMESGLVRLIVSLLLRMIKKLGSKDITLLLNYVAGQGAWEFPEVSDESPEANAQAVAQWESHLASLDTAIFSLLGDAQVSDEQVEAKLDEVLASSLFNRRLARLQEGSRKILSASLTARAKFVWANSTAQQRRGYFLSGVGLAAGKELDKRSQELEALLLSANFAIGTGDGETAIEAIVAFARVAFTIAPFGPNKLLVNWEQVLRLWLLGRPVTEIGGDCEAAVSLIEHAFVYNLPWAMEAVRVRATAHENIFSDEPKLSDYPRAHAVAAVETGTLLVAATTLIQAGFASRLAAIRAVEVTGALFDSFSGMMSWLNSSEVQAQSANPAWPTTDSHELWLTFIEPNAIQASKPWSAITYEGPVAWHSVPLPPGTPLRLGGGPGKERAVYKADFSEVGTLGWTPNPEAVGISRAIATGENDKLQFEYLGPDYPAV
ncbi:putative helicase HelY [Pandoraea horticolens]|uniref:Putative helicase HelY n=1 Tax=Pandoraea horticolens TaxID=2508298 RepID=A0A5E4V2H4_9BURK|nr:DEAD/DEAH box helicase [Pandoraea horticolens]VVE04990.1 putative helicase HelY [Pandoraea horticolens]